MKILFLFTLFNYQIQNNNSILDSAKVARADGHFDLAIEYSNKASLNFKSNNDWEGYIRSELLKAVIYTNDKNDFDSAFFTYESAVEVGIKNLGVKNIFIAQLENDLGALYFIIGDLDNALIHYEKALQICLETIGPKHSSTALVLDNIGLIYLRRKIYHKAQEYSSKALQVRIEKLGENSQYTSTSYLNTSLAFFYTDPEKSLLYLKKTIQIRKKLFGVDSYRYASALRSLTDYYLESSNIDSAEVTARQAVKLYTSYYGLNNISSQSAIVDLADVMRQSEKLREADSLNNLTIKFFQTRNIQNSELLGRAYLGLAKSSIVHKDYSKVESNLFRALNANRYQTLAFTSKSNYVKLANDIIDTELHFRILKTFIYSHIDVLENQSIDNWNPLTDYLRIFVDNIKRLNDPLLNAGIHKSSTENEWNQVLNDVLTFSYKEKIKNKSVIQNEIYPLLSEGKSVVLTNRLENKKGTDFETISRIKLLSRKINYFKAKLINISSDSSKNVIYKRRLSEYHLKYDSLTRVLSSANNSEYSQHLNPQKKSNDYQSHTLEYFYANQFIYYFLSENKEVIDFNRVKLTGDIISTLNKKSHSLEELKHLSKVFYSPLKDYLNSSHFRLIPDGLLWNVNFDLLLTDDPKSDNPKEIPYLLKKYSISYAYSASSFTRNIVKSKHTNKTLLAFSFGESDNIYGKSLSLRTLRSSKEELPGSRAEVRTIANFIDGDYYYGNQASEKKFKDLASDYQILHLAIHGDIDNLEPENSKLYFYSEGDTIEDGRLHAFELYNMDIGADLAVLSACNTGSGKIIKGEGIISLGRAFAYAGVNSLLLTRWEVSDAFTPQIMKVFYRELKKGKRKSEALRIAKLEFLENADNLSSDPFYWSSFYILGNDSPIEFDESEYSKYFIGVGILIIIVLIWFFIVRNRATQSNSIEALTK